MFHVLIVTTRLLNTSLISHPCPYAQLGRVPGSQREASSLVIAEHNGESVVPLTYNAIAAARQLGGDITALVAGPDCGKVV